MQTKPIAILGAGSWGTALALYLSRQNHPVNLWSIESSEIEAMLADKANTRYLPGIALPDLIQPTIELSAAVEKADDILIVVPSIGYRHTLTLLKPFIRSHHRLICATKGLEADTGKLLSDVTKSMYPHLPFAMLSGPSFAKEVALGLPCAVMIASQDSHFLQATLQKFNSDIFRVFGTDDVRGVEAGGVVKNVLAIATGISDGLKRGANARSALLTEGLAEMIALGVALGGKHETFLGLAGLGDMLLTATDDLSRNRRFGLAVGQGQSIAEAEHAIGQIVEGKRNAELVMLLAAKHQLHLPICAAVWEVLQSKCSPAEAAPKFLGSVKDNP